MDVTQSLQNEVDRLTKSTNQLSNGYSTLLSKHNSHTKQIASMTKLAVDVDLQHADSMIIIVSRADGGRVKFIRTRIDNAVQLKELIAKLENEYGVIVNETIYDVPRSFRPMFDR